jgi:uncharacterized protein
MLINLEPSGGVNFISAYSNQEIRVHDLRLVSSCIISAHAIVSDLALTCLDNIDDNLLDRVLALAPELVLLGTGPTQQFAPAKIVARFARAQIGLEVMSTGAACRTYNVLLSEQRKVVALLLL